MTTNCSTTSGLAIRSRRDVPPPDLVIYLQTPVEVVRKRLRRAHQGDPSTPLPSAYYIQE